MLAEHLGYLADPVRLDRFRAAIHKVVKSGDRVADLGCGTGILGLLCLQAGASFVYLIDNSAMIDVARQTFERAGVAGQARFIKARSQQAELPERVDVILCDHVGYFGFDYGIVDLIEDTRARLLKPQGSLMPRRLKLQISAIESGDCRSLALAWQAPAVPAQYHWLSEYAINTKHAVNLSPKDLLSAPASLGAIDLGKDNPGFYSWSAELVMHRKGLLHGLGGWFDCELGPGVTMTNSPLSEQPIKRSQVFLPIADAVPVDAGEAVNVQLSARPADDLIAWTVEFPRSGRRFRHSTWNGRLMTAEDLLRANPGRIPSPSAQGRARAIVLGYCDGHRTAHDIELAVLRDHPALLASQAEISRFVAQVLSQDAGP